MIKKTFKCPGYWHSKDLIRLAFLRLLSSGSLVLSSPSSEDAGYFECTAVNDVGEERRVIEVILQGNDWTFFLHV